MTLTEELKSNPYFKVSNCLDSSDCKNAINDLYRLEDKYGKSKMIDKVFDKLFRKKKKLDSNGLN